MVKRAYVTYLGSNDYLIGTISLYLSLISGGGTISIYRDDFSTDW